MGRAFAVGLALWAGAAGAHDFWMQPSSAASVPGDTVGLALMVGHGDERRQSPIAARRITRLDVVAPDGGATALGGRVFRADVAGVYAVLLQTDSAAQSHLPAPQFNAYLHVEGLGAVQAHRERNRLHGEPGAERYSRVAKALVAIGAAGGAGGSRDTSGAGSLGWADDAGAASLVEAMGRDGRASGKAGNATRAFELPLELVLERSPFGGGKTPRLPVRVLYKGRPLPGGLVKLTDLARDEEPVAAARTDAQGRVQFDLPHRGNWLLNVVWSEPVQRDDGIDYETIFSSLVWDNSARNEEESPHRDLP